jgi:hypothetical protein
VFDSILELSGESVVSALATAVPWPTTSMFELLLQAVATNPKAMKTTTTGERERFTPSE